MSDGRELRMRIESKGWRGLEREDEGEKIAQTGDLASAGSFILRQKCLRRLVDSLKVVCTPVRKKKKKNLIEDINVTLSTVSDFCLGNNAVWLYVEEQQFVILPWDILQAFLQVKKPQTGTNNRIICQDATLCTIVTATITQSVWVCTSLPQLELTSGVFWEISLGDKFII